MNSKNFLLFVLLLGNAFAAERPDITDDAALRRSNPGRDPFHDKLVALNRENIQDLPLESELLIHAYTQLLLTEEFSANPADILRGNEPALPSRWRIAAAADILRRATDVQPVIESIFENAGQHKPLLLAKLAALPDIDKGFALQWVRQRLTPDKLKTESPILKSLNVDFLANFGTLDDLLLLKRLGQTGILDPTAFEKTVNARMEVFKLKEPLRIEE